MNWPCQEVTTYGSNPANMASILHENVQRIQRIIDLSAALQVVGGFEGPITLEAVHLDWQVDYNAALATICFMLFLGFADDVLDIPWVS